MSQQDSQRRDQAKVVKSLEDADGFRCVDILERPDGIFSFKEFRRDPEDAGRWTLLGDYSQYSYSTKDDALRAAATNLAWFSALIKSGSE
jgi:hypothetical protein